jgi:microcystin-dependent protein
MITKKLIPLTLIVPLFILILPIKTALSASDNFIGEINYFAGNFAPKGWAFCDGQLLLIAQNTALFSLLGTTYGGDGRTTFALPEVRGRVLIHPGTGAGITSKQWGEKSGSETVTLTASNLPAHNHTFNVSVDNPTSTTPTNRAIASGELYSSAPTDRTLHASTIEPKGENSSINNMQPSVTARCIIALTGIYPSRS